MIIVVHSFAVLHLSQRVFVSVQSIEQGVVGRQSTKVDDEGWFWGDMYWCAEGLRSGKPLRLLPRGGAVFERE